MSSLPRIGRPTALSAVSPFPPERRTDASLVEGAAAGDREAIGAIWDRYSGLVRGVLHGALGPDQAIEDLVQEVFLAFLRGAGKMDDGAALRGYLASVAVRQAALEIRKRKVRRWVGLSATGELPERVAPTEDIEGRAALHALYRVLDKLPSRRRLAFVLRHVQGLELLEAAAALGVSESTLRRELVTGREQVLLWAGREPALAEFLARMKESHRE